MGILYSFESRMPIEEIKPKWYEVPHLKRLSNFALDHGNTTSFIAAVSVIAAVAVHSFLKDGLWPFEKRLRQETTLQVHQDVSNQALQHIIYSSVSRFEDTIHSLFARNDIPLDQKLDVMHTLSQKQCSENDLGKIMTFITQYDPCFQPGLETEVRCMLSLTKQTAPNP